MGARTYILRSVKYIIRITVLLGIIFAAMMLTKTTYITPASMVSELFLSQKGAILLIALLAVAATYPIFGFVKRDVKGSFADNRDAIVNTMAMSGYALDSETEGGMVFRAKSRLKRMLKQWDDAVKISGDGRFITIEGNRQEVVKAQYRLGSFINN